MIDDTNGYRDEYLSEEGKMNHYNKSHVTIHSPANSNIALSLGVGNSGGGGNNITNPVNGNNHDSVSNGHSKTNHMTASVEIKSRRDWTNEMAQTYA